MKIGLEFEHDRYAELLLEDSLNFKRKMESKKILLGFGSKLL